MYRPNLKSVVALPVPEIIGVPKNVGHPLGSGRQTTVALWKSVIFIVCYWPMVICSETLGKLCIYNTGYTALRRLFSGPQMDDLALFTRSVYYYTTTVYYYFSLLPLGYVGGE